MYVLDFTCVYDMVHRSYRKLHTACKVAISCPPKSINLLLYDSNHCSSIYINLQTMYYNNMQIFIKYYTCNMLT